MSARWISRYALPRRCCSRLRINLYGQHLGIVSGWLSLNCNFKVFVTRPRTCLTYGSEKKTEVKPNERTTSDKRLLWPKECRFIREDKVHKWYKRETTFIIKRGKQNNLKWGLNRMLYLQWRNTLRRRRYLGMGRNKTQDYKGTWKLILNETPKNLDGCRLGDD